MSTSNLTDEEKQKSQKQLLMRVLHELRAGVGGGGSGNSLLKAYQEGTTNSEVLESVAQALKVRIDSQDGSIDVSGSSNITVNNISNILSSLQSLESALESNGGDRFLSEMELDDGQGNYNTIERVSNAVKVYLDDQNGSVDVSGSSNLTVNDISSIVASTQSIDSGIGDESSGGDVADSTSPASVLERLGALVDALESGQSDDELRAAIYGLQLLNGSGSLEDVEMDPSENAIQVVEQLRPTYEVPAREKAYVEQNTQRRDSTTGHSTQASWTTVASLNVYNVASPLDDDINFWKAARPYVKNTSAGGNTTDARLLMAIDPTASVGDAPTGALSDGDGFMIVDDVEAMASGGDWPEKGQFYERDTHLFVLQIQQGDGQETVDAYLDADREV